MTEPALRYEKRDAIAYLTLNRPEKHNAFTPELLCRLVDAWHDYLADDALRVAILTGAGDRAFSAGADLGRLTPLMSGARAPADEWDRRLLAHPEIAQQATLRGIDMQKPVISAIKGYCLAGGCELMQATDIRIAADDASFALTEVKWSLLPYAGSMVRLPRQVPFCKAMEIMLVGDTFAAQEAYRIGLVNYVLPSDEVLPKAEALARKIAENGPLAVRLIKQVVLSSIGRPLEDGFAIERAAAQKILATEDAREGPRAFLEKRKPQYSGK